MKETKVSNNYKWANKTDEKVGIKLLVSTVPQSKDAAYFEASRKLKESGYPMLSSTIQRSGQG